MSFPTIPNEMILDIAKHLADDDLSRLSRTNYTYKTLLDSLLLRRAKQDHLVRCILCDLPASVRSILRSNTINIEHKIRISCTYGDVPPLHHAAFAGRAEIVSILIGHGALVDGPESQDNQNCLGTLQYAVLGGSVETVTIVLDAGANLDRTTNNNASTALAVACLKNREAIANLLIDRGARLTGTVLAFAAQSGCLTVLERVLEMGLPVDSSHTYKSDAPVTALLHVCMLSWPTACLAAEILLRRGADVNYVYSGLHAIFPLYCAVRMNGAPLARLLLAFGADRDMLYEGKTMVAIAEERGHHDVLSLLVREEE